MISKGYKRYYIFTNYVLYVYESQIFYLDPIQMSKKLEFVANRILTDLNEFYISTKNILKIGYIVLGSDVVLIYWLARIK